jgi:Zn finger protein HypA/HybF involved in hydrogenase expression
LPIRSYQIAAGLKNNKCEVCGLEEWAGMPIEMELHHVNGDRTDHRLDNLEMICPNCHSQTMNFRAKNIKAKL